MNIKWTFSSTDDSAVAYGLDSRRPTSHRTQVLILRTIAIVLCLNGPLLTASHTRTTQRPYPPLSPLLNSPALLFKTDNATKTHLTWPARRNQRTRAFAGIKGKSLLLPSHLGPHALRVLAHPALCSHRCVFCHRDILSNRDIHIYVLYKRRHTSMPASTELLPVGIWLFLIRGLWGISFVGVYRLRFVLSFHHASLSGSDSTLSLSQPIVIGVSF
ncbi:hypothetical protein BDN70DRAFT_286967 [Pholiota conissans]|uniref:Uncharacterized protein n=1 Tax=Pholiota conissans TaxID=109636 RepID=A0A9P5YTP5_9AGAR|nr:hypothetical protein BDN70DRAFT_286967 [Pholiota conissans]